MVSDAFGHHWGDVVLQKVAVQLRESLRSLDMVARMGGEEFVVILPETDVNGASQVAHRMVATIRENPVEIDKGLLSITVSIGVRSGNVTEPTQMLSEADQALYIAKKAGKNGFEIYGRLGSQSTIDSPAVQMN